MIFLYYLRTFVWKSTKTCIYKKIQFYRDMRTVKIFTAIALSTMMAGVTSIATAQDKVVVANSVLINGVRWALSNVGDKGTFAADPADRDNYYTFDEAQTACPAGWRLPTKEEFEGLIAVGSEFGTASRILGRQYGSRNNSFFLPISNRSKVPAATHAVVVTAYWLETPYSATDSYALWMHPFRSDSIRILPRNLSLAVRCVSDSPATQPDTSADSVTINGVVWATRNVGHRGIFVAKPEDIGNYYLYDEAKTACPAGWRVPTKAEFESLAAAGSEFAEHHNINGQQFGSGDHSIFLPFTGARDTEGDITNTGLGLYRSATPFNTFGSYILLIRHGSAFTDNAYHNSLGFALRCVMESPVDKPDTSADRATINNVVWATRNVGDKGTFATNPEDFDYYYNFDEAQTVCPVGWRLPTKEEFESLYATGGEFEMYRNVLGRRFGSGDDSIFLPSTGYKYRSGKSDGRPQNDNMGYYWSSTPSSEPSGYFLDFTEGVRIPSPNHNHANGFAVRCVLDVTD